MKNIRIGILILCFLASSELFAKEAISNSVKPAKTDTQIVEQIVDNYVSNGAFEGVILVSKSGRKIFEKAYGFANRAERKPITNSSAFQLASLSKPITATMILMLKEQEKLSLSHTLADYFPEFNNTTGKQITIHHLLSHTSGIPNHFTIDGWFNSDFHSSTTEQQFIEIIAKLPITFEPGADYLYSNPGYFLLGKIIEKVTGVPFSENVRKSIFEPLNMTHSGVAVGSQQSADVVKAYQWSGDGGYEVLADKNMTLFGAGAAIFSNAEDLYRFDMALYGNKLINKESKKQLFNPESPYSWRVGVVPINQSIQANVHMYDGKIDGYSSMMMRFIDAKHSIILLSNTGMSYSLKQQLMLDVASALFNRTVPNRKRDVSLALTNSINSGNFEKVLRELKTDNYDLDEQKMTAIAYELLWSGLADKSLHLFAFISDRFNESTTAKSNLTRACDHRLTKSVKDKATICSAVQ
ncbi:serine hydrolase domain-containing protein [Flocculibacter collagenilyticus]|uniref:serine hydrolase domain-containing protein n=1 Tax=Flocculibacter collagenilyticus TaxID=2744479 RepID=UPI0018F704C0|nr:serine hydrolase domain-containing protein [Flocculibacter collagenilyticus]